MPESSQVIKMPSRSAKQKRFMQMCEHNPEHAKGKCPSMSRQQYKDFTKGPVIPSKGKRPHGSGEFTAQEFRMGYRRVR